MKRTCAGVKASNQTSSRIRTWHYRRLRAVNSLLRVELGVARSCDAVNMPIRPVLWIPWDRALVQRVVGSRSQEG